MVGDANRRARRARAAAIIACGVFGLQLLPTASAAKGGAGSTASSAGEGTAAARRAERQAAKTEGASAPTVVAPPTVETSAPPAVPLRGHRSQPGPPPAPPAAQGAGAGTGARKGDRPAAVATRAQRREERREERRAGSISSSTGAGQAVAVTSEESSAGQAETFARKQKKGGGQKGKKEHKEKGKKPQEEGSGGEGAGAEGSSGANAKGKGELSAGADVAQASATSASLAPAVVPTSGIAPASVSSALPAVKAGLNGVVAANHAGRRAARRARKSSSGTTVAAVSASVSPLLATQSSVSAAAPSRASHAGAKRSQQSSTQPALVKTFTKIVGVVPTPVWILIGALILLASMLGVRSLLSGARTRRLVRQRCQLLEDVGLLQAALLPVSPARLGPVATSVAYRPADGPGAGGDFYDVFALEDGQIAVIVGDVSGHGREALPHTALLRFTVRAYLEAGLSPRKALQTAGSVLDRQLAGSFATVLAATYNPRERKLTYASAGHPPPVVLGLQRDGDATTNEGEQAVRALAPVTSCSAPPIGAGMRTGTRQTVVSVPGPARLCFHTDGVTEARVGGDLFGTGRLTGVLSGLDRDADATALLDRVAEQSDARPDDMAACLLRVHDGHGAPAIELEQLECNRGLLAGGRVERFLLDCGVELGEAEALVHDAQRRLERSDGVMLELARGADGRLVASLVDDNVIHAPVLATAGAS